jgi:hypothetical protein
MSKEKNKNTFRVAALLLVACLISSVMLSGTFAKYTSEYAGADTALVATWNFVAEGGQDGEDLDLVPLEGAAVELDLFKHAYNDNILATAGAGKIIAPGVSGNFVLNLTNNSDVAAGITFTITEDTSVADIPMEFGIGDENGDFNFDADGAIIYANVVDLTTALNKLGPSGGNIQLAASDGDNTESVTVHWRWKFERGSTQEDIDHNDEGDTTLGMNSYTAYNYGAGARIGYILTVKVKATQLEPGTV